MSKIVLGKSDGHDVSIDLNTLLSTRLLVTADSGGGKTFALKRLCEQAFGKVQIIILDPEGEFSPMRQKLDFVLVGPGGETPADVRSASLVAQTLLRERASAVCDIYDMKPTERHIFVQRFLDGLIEAPKNLRHPCWVIVDEAHMFCPERGKGESVATDSMNGLCTRGRKRLLCAIFATQRLATLSKDASSMLLNRLVGPTFEDLNRKRAIETLSIPKEEQAEFKKQIQLLEPGYFWALGRAITKERKLVHIGAITTPHGQEARRYETSPPPAPANIKALLPKLADLPKLAEEKAATEAELRQENRLLKAQLRQASMHTKVGNSGPGVVKAPTNVDMKRATAPLRALLGEAMKIIAKVNAIGFDGTTIKPEDVKAAMDAAAKQIAKLAESKLKRQQDDFERLKGEINRLMAKLKKVLDQDEITVTIDVKRNEPVTISQPVDRPLPKVNRALPEGNGDLGGPEVRILTALAQLRAIGRDPAVKPMVAAWSGYSSALGGAFGNPIGRLRTMGLVEYPQPGTVTLTDAGAEKVGEQEPPTQETIDGLILSLLDGPGRRILSALREFGKGHRIAKQELAQLAGYESATGGAFGNPIGRLRTAGFVSYPNPGFVQAADWLWLD